MAMKHSKDPARNSSHPYGGFYRQSNLWSIMHQRTDANNSESKMQSTDNNKSSNDIDFKAGDELSTNVKNKKVNKTLGNTLERTSSSCDLKVIPPLRNKRREYRSHEVLPVEENLMAGQNYNTLDILPSQSEVQINNLHDTNKLKVPRVSIFHENQRAEIVTSVTDRLYSKLKKKEEAAVSKMETLVDKKIVEPLSELKICSNARQRLIELSQKAIRNRRKIGIPAYTQTRESVIRVKEKSIDIQNDLEAYCLKNDNIFICRRDVSTETLPMIPRFKDVGVGSKYVLSNYCNRSTMTESKQSIYKNSCIMTEATIKYDNFTQTLIMPPARRRRRRTKKEQKVYDINNIDSSKILSSSTIRINISQTCNIDSESQSSEDNIIQVTAKSNHDATTISPDILDTKENNVTFNSTNDIQTLEDSTLTIEEDSKEFSDDEVNKLPRVKPDSSRKSYKSDIKDLILGRNKNTYPYNIVVSPLKEREHSKRLVTFRDLNPVNKMDAKSYITDEENVDETRIPCFTSESMVLEKNVLNDINSFESAGSFDFNELYKANTNSVICSNDIPDNKAMSYVNRNYVPVYRSKSKYKTAKARLYKDLGLEVCDANPRKLFSTNEQNYVETIPSGSSDKLDQSEFISRHKQIIRNLVNKRNCNKVNEYEGIEKHLFDGCSELESTVSKYNSYNETSRNTLNTDKDKISLKINSTPTEYLQHLIRLRREVVKMEQVCNKASYDNQQNFI